MKFEVEKEMVEPIIRDQIAAAIVAQIGNPTELIKKMVHLALSQKVNREAEVSRYSSDNRYSFVEALTAKAIREAAREALERIISAHQSEIEDAVVRELRRSPRKTAAALVAGFVDAASVRQRVNVKLEIEEIK